MSEPAKTLAVIEAVRKGDADALTVALAEGGKATEIDDFGNSALMYAAAGGHPELCRQLIEAGADPSHANKWNMTARDWAQWAEKQEETYAAISTAH